MKYFLGMVEQGGVSILNIGINIWLVRVGGTELSGMYNFWFNIALIASSVQFGLTFCHLVTLPPGPGTNAERRGVEQIMLSVTYALFLASTLIAVVVVLFVGHAAGSDSLAFIAFVPAYMAYQYARGLAFTRGAMLTATLLTTAVVILTVTGLGIAHFTAPSLDANQVLLIASIAYGAAGIVALWRLNAGLRPSLGDLRRYLPYLRVSRWSMMGIVCFEIMTRLPFFAVAGWLGTAALGRFTILQIPSRPPALLVAAMQPAMRNDLAVHRVAGDWRRFVRQTVRGSVLAIAISVLWVAPIYFGWPLLVRYVFHNQFAVDLDIGVLWTANQGFASLISAVSIAFQVCGAFRMAGMADLGGTVGTMIGLAILLPPFGLGGAIVATMLGQICYIGMMAVQWRHLRPLMYTANRAEFSPPAATQTVEALTT